MVRGETAGADDVCDISAVSDAIRRITAEVITPRFRSLRAHEVIEKNPGDLVTIADREAERALTSYLHRVAPGALVIGEEATAADPAILDALPSAVDAFLVDPVDGTKNFVAGSPDFAVMVTQLHAGVPTRVWIFQPEHGRMIIAERGSGVYVDGVRVRRQPASTEPELMRVVASRERSQGQFGPLTVRATAWCCGVDYPALVMGEIDAILYTRGWPWDHAPGALLVSEAGGVMTTRSGEAYDPTRVHRGGLMAASDAHVWATADALIP